MANEPKIVDKVGHCVVDILLNQQEADCEPCHFSLIVGFFAYHRLFYSTAYYDYTSSATSSVKQLKKTEIPGPEKSVQTMATTFP